MVWKTFTRTAWAAIVSALSCRAFEATGAQIKQEPFKCWMDWGLFFLCLQVCICGTIYSTTLGVTQDEDKTSTQLSSAEFQAAHHAALGMRAGVASVAKHKDVTRQGVKESLQRTSGISASNDGGVWGLSLAVQLLSHDRIHLRRLWLPLDKALVPFLQEPQCQLRGHWRIATGSHLTICTWQKCATSFSAAKICYMNPCVLRQKSCQTGSAWAISGKSVAERAGPSLVSCDVLCWCPCHSCSQGPLAKRIR